MTAFYRIIRDTRLSARWVIDEPVDPSGKVVCAVNFREGERYQGDVPLTMPLYQQGLQLDFNFSTFDAVVTPAELNAEIESRFGIRAERIPVRVDSSKTQFEILNVLDLLHCIDERASEFIKWNENDGRPEKVGRYRMFTRMRIVPATAVGYHLFRIEEWPIPLIASAQLKQFLEERRVTGIDFLPVTSVTD